MRHTISLLLSNEVGALTRVAGLFTARGYNIESLTVAPTENPELSRMTIATAGSEDVITQVVKQLKKLVDVVDVKDLTDDAHLERELMLLKCNAEGSMRDEIKRLADIFRANIVDVSATSYVVELTGTARKIDGFIAAVGNDNIKELARSGVTSVARGEASLHL